jgi:hypothetical protein
MATVYTTTLPRQAQAAIAIAKQFAQRGDAWGARQMRRAAHTYRISAIMMKRHQVKAQRAWRNKVADAVIRLVTNIILLVCALWLFVLYLSR